ncbi:serine/threonine-protein phosphatase 7 long form-like protein isoform X2 [Gossypium australe]|uniref:Serine/threonine-protein phosphatase 7 long form-like protein isoform X2 n=1 Tax=Gossypium australe TaxID=47621 RepID=A0A5B6VKI1_9ROSI|nr:serine/threonine-protein phosphatase 7 long form-like protein isoform X2 [Gossypium australe]
MNWLKRDFDELDTELNPLEMEQYARANILRIIRGLLMPDKLHNLVHLMWLLQFMDLKEASQLNWGSAVLVMLYRKMCQAAQPQKIKIDGCMLLLQSYAWYRLSFLCPRVDYAYTFPLVIRFRQMIPPPPQDIGDQHKIDLWGRIEED